MRFVLPLLFFLISLSIVAKAEVQACKLALLNPSQIELAKKIEAKWQDTITNNHQYRSLQSFYLNSVEDPKIASLLPQIDFTLDHTKQIVHYPKDPWSFLKKSKDYLKGQDGITPSIALYKTGTKKEFKFITDVSDIPENADQWAIVSTEIDSMVYYTALTQGFLPITLSVNYEDHEFQHVLTFYHPDHFPHYMQATKKMAKRYVEKKLSDKMVFIFLESFSFVRPNTRESFDSFADRWDLNLISFKEVHSDIQRLNKEQLQVLSEEFLILFPKLMVHLGGLIRETQLLPLKHEPLNFLDNWRSARNDHKSSNERFIYQNWRTLYTNLVLAHNFSFPPISYEVAAAHTGISIIQLEDYRIHRPKFNEDNKLPYLRMGLAELIWGLHQAYGLNLTASQVLTAATDLDHPEHQKVKAFFEQTYPSSVYDYAFKIEENRKKLKSILNE